MRCLAAAMNPICESMICRSIFATGEQEVCVQVSANKSNRAICPPSQRRQAGACCRQDLKQAARRPSRLAHAHAIHLTYGQALNTPIAEPQAQKWAARTRRGLRTQKMLRWLTRRKRRRVEGKLAPAGGICAVGLAPASCGWCAYE
jgi:hypothetical protein